MPGLRYAASKMPMDLSYDAVYPNAYKGDAYERMFWNCARGDNSLFVGVHELKEAWRIFTPLLKQIDSERPQPAIYKFGTRGPDRLDSWSKGYGVVQQPLWQEVLALNAQDTE